MLDRDTITQALTAREGFMDVRWLAEMAGPQIVQAGETATPEEAALQEALLALVGPLIRAEQALKAWEAAHWNSYHTPEETE